MCTVHFYRFPLKQILMSCLGLQLQNLLLTVLFESKIFHCQDFCIKEHDY